MELFNSASNNCIIFISCTLCPGIYALLSELPMDRNDHVQKYIFSNSCTKLKLLSHFFLTGLRDGVDLNIFYFERKKRNTDDNRRTCDHVIWTRL